MNVNYDLKKYSILLLVGGLITLITKPYAYSQTYILATDGYEVKTSFVLKREEFKSGNIIFKAYINGDTLTIKKPNPFSWAKKHMPTTINDYINALQNEQEPLIIYSIDTYQIQIYSGAALVYYTGTIQNELRETTLETSQPLVGVYQKRKGYWAQVDSLMPLKNI